VRAASAAINSESFGFTERLHERRSGSAQITAVSCKPSDDPTISDLGINDIIKTVLLIPGSRSGEACAIVVMHENAS
jgi:hypothetical protein